MTDDGGRRGEGMPPEIPQPPCARPSASCLTARMIWFAIANAERPFELLLLAATRYAAPATWGTEQSSERRSAPLAELAHWRPTMMRKCAKASLILVLLVGCGGDPPKCFLPAGSYATSAKLTSNTCTFTPTLTDNVATYGAGEVPCGPVHKESVTTSANGCVWQHTLTGEVTETGWRNAGHDARISCPGAKPCDAHFDVFFSLQ